jgi:hypothetical protein
MTSLTVYHPRARGAHNMCYVTRAGARSNGHSRPTLLLDLWAFGHLLKDDEPGEA